MQDKPATLSDMEKTEIRRLLPKATTEDVGDILSSSFLEPALTRAKQREYHELQAKKDFAKKLENPMKKLNECINIMESVKARISIATDSELLFLGDQYLKAYQNYQKAYAEVKTLNANASTMGYDPLPTNTTEKLSWLSTMRRIWREKKVKK